VNALRFNTFGVFKVIAPGDEDVTPRAQKVCGLLAILLESPKMSRSRAALQDMLWSDREQAQGAASLRQALTVIRQSFGACRDVLRADLHVVSLDPLRVVYERDPRQGEFLEGIGVRDPEFEDWLRDMRLAFDEPRGERPGSARGVSVGDESGIALVVPRLFLCSADGAQLAPFIQQAIAKGVSDWGAVDVLTVRPGLIDPWGQKDAFVLEVGDRPVQAGVAIRMVMSAASDGRVLWQDTAIVKIAGDPLADQALARTVNTGIDRSVEAIAAASGDDSPFPPVRRIFLTPGQEYGLVTQRLDRFGEVTGRGIYAAWHAYLTVFQVIDEQWRSSDRRGVIVEAEENVRRALETEAHNPMALSISSLVNSTVLENHAVARELAERAVALNPQGPLGWAYLGLSNVHNRRLSEAYEQLVRARALSGEGPYRYAVDAIACVTNLLTGRFEAAVQIGETVHARMPDYAPNLRYLLGAYLVAKDMPKVERTVERLRRIEPGFTLSLLAEPEYPVNSLRTNDLLPLKSMPKSI
jgi:hypothetical protein